MNNAEYMEFLERRAIRPKESGFDFAANSLNPMLFDWQREIVSWCLRLGRAAIFADCGLGKTPMQLEIAHRVCKHEGQHAKALILAPLAVSEQTAREAHKFGILANIVKDQSEVRPGISITNYEKLDKFDPAEFVCVVLDESSILKSFSGKMKNQIESSFFETRYKFACTATPAPNDYMEIGNHAQFLGIMPSNEMLSRFFINDTMNMGKYRVKKHAVDDFWAWVSSWAVALERPSDIGYDDAGFVLPGLSEQIVNVQSDALKIEGELFTVMAVSATDLHKVKRATAPMRAAAVAEEVAKIPNDPFIIWCQTNNEADLLRKALPEAVEVRGNEKDSVKAEKLLGFADGKYRILITKASIAGFGMNWQHCHNMIFAGLDYSYEQYYQAIRRCYRFGQKETVNVRIIMTQQEQGIWNAVKDKADRHSEMRSAMYKNFTFNARGAGKLSIDYKRKEIKGDGWTMINGDCVEESQSIADNSIDFSVFSPPFTSLYIYSDSARDMGNCKDDKEFMEHFDLLIKDFHRIMRPGRLVAVHCKNLVYYQNSNGTAGLRDFRGDIIKAFQLQGFDYHSEVTIWKDPVTEMQRTKAHGLLHKQLCKDSTFSRQGLPDYLVIFRKWADESNESLVRPVCGESDEYRFDSYVGEETFETTSQRDMSISVWQRYASPVWFDIRQTNVLNTEFSADERDEKHICPLQLDVIERAIELWTNPGDVVFSPFAGIGSEGYGAIKHNRKFIGIELKESYFEVACRNLQNAVDDKKQISFDFASGANTKP